MFVKVTAELAGPIALSAEGIAPNLDAIVECVVAGKALTIADSSNGNRHAIDRTRPRGQPVEKPGQLPTPIKREWVDGLPIPRVSSGIIEKLPESAEHYHCAFPIERASMLKESQRTKIPQTGGPYKSMRLPLRLSHTRRIVWFAELYRSPGRAPMCELRKILRKVTTIGKKSAYGYGAVSKWTVEPTELDASWIHSGVLMRPLPISLVTDGIQGAMRSYGAVCGPYWQSNLFRERWVPVW